MTNRRHHSSPASKTATAGVMVVILLALSTSTATAHPSDFRTLTVDLLIGPEGLELIDGAAIQAEGPGYEPFPTGAQRAAVAAEVLEALGLTSVDVQIDPEMSELYHEVGFTIQFVEPSHGGHSPFAFDTEALIDLVRTLALEHLKLAICALDPSDLGQLQIEASQPGRAPDYVRNERSGCLIWELSPLDPTVSVVVGPSVLPATGSSFGPLALLSLALVVLGRIVGNHKVRKEAVR